MDNFGDLPQLDEESDCATDLDYSVGLVVQNIQHDDERREDVEEDRPHRQTLQGLPGPPELDVVLESQELEHTVHN